MNREAAHGFPPERGRRVFTAGCFLGEGVTAVSVERKLETNPVISTTARFVSNELESVRRC
jgi:hypothetical protein